MSKKTVIKVENLSKTFKLPTRAKHTVQSYFLNPFEKREFHEFVALKDLNFEVYKGEFFSVIGRNGAGKSTLLKIIAGIYDGNKGSVEVEGHLVPFLELGVGFHPDLTAKENVYLNGILLGLTRNQVTDYLDEIFEFAELPEFIDVPIKNFSSGMQVRLAFSVAIKVHSDILLLDEVLAVGDVNFQKKCYDYFDSIRGKKTVIFVSHDLESVLSYSDRVLYLKEDKSFEIGKPSEIVQRYKDEISS